MVKNLPANAGARETWVQSSGREDSLEEGMASRSGILAGIVPWTVEPGGLYSPQGCRRVRDNRAHTYTLYSGTLLFICLIYSRLYLLTPNSKFISSLSFPFENPKFVSYVCVSVSIL